MIENFLIHWQSRKKIVLYLAGGLPVKERFAFETHLSKCEKCREILEMEQQFNKEIFSACAPMSAALNRTRARLQDLPNYYDSPINVPIRKMKWKPSLQFWDWQISRTLVAVCIVTIILMFVGEYFSFTHLTPYSVPKYSSKVSKSLGEGLWLQAYRKTDWQKLDANKPVLAGDKIRTDEFGRGLIKLGSGGQVWLNHSTQITLLSNLNTAFEVNKGEVYIALNHHHGLFQVKTPSGIVRVYGTEFQISVETASLNTKVFCFQNTVYFDSKQGGVILPAGYESEANPHSKPTVPTLFDLPQMVYWKTQFDQLSLLSEKESKQLHQSFVQQGDLLFDNKKYDEALKFYRVAVFLDPNDYVPYYGIGRAYRELGQFGMATATYLQAVDRNPYEHSFLYQLVVCLMELKKYQEAEQVLSQARPFNQTEWVLLGNTYLLERQTDKAEEAFGEAQKLGSEISEVNNPQVHGGLAEIARQRGDYKTAINEINKALQSKSKSSMVYAEAGWIYRDKKNQTEEKSAWENYLKLDPYGSFAEEARKRISELSPSKI